MFNPLHARIAAAVLAIALAATSQGAAQPAPDTAASPPPAVPLQAPAIRWRVVDRFRLFLADPAPAVPIAIAAGQAPSPGDRLLDDLAFVEPWSADERRDDYARTYAVLSDFLSRKQSFGAAGVVLPYRGTHWRYAQGQPGGARSYDDDYLYPGAYVIGASLTGLAAPAGATCAWRFSIAGRPDQTLSTPCDREARVAAPGNAKHTGAEPVTISVAVSAPVPSAPVLAVSAEVRDRLIISLGDSYASGEGNPDEAARYALANTPAPDWNKELINRWWLDSKNLAHVAIARWSDPWCHRSLYTQHFVASVVYAAAHPHEAVTYASFACSGAQVIEGIVAVQAQPPGAPEFGTPPGQVSQLQDTQDLLCRNHIDRSGANVDMVALVDGLDQAQADRSLVRSTAPNLYTQCAGGGRPRDPDAILLSIGGNDVGFSGVVMNGLLTITPTDDFGKEALKIVKSAIHPVTPDDAHERVETVLPVVFKVADTAFDAAFAHKPVIVQSQYPTPVYDEQGQPCDGRPRSALFTTIAGLFPDETVADGSRWPIIITAATSTAAQTEVLEPMNQQIDQNAREFGWRVNGAFQPMFMHHGWCAAGPQEVVATSFIFPQFDQAAWTPVTPASWQAYAPRARWFRPTNDAVLTQISNTSGDNVIPGNAGLGRFLQGVAQHIPLLREQLYFTEAGPVQATAGTFHPTFQGHLAVGIGAATILNDAEP